MDLKTWFIHYFKPTWPFVIGFFILHLFLEVTFPSFSKVVSSLPYDHLGAQVLLQIYSWVSNPVAMIGFKLGVLDSGWYYIGFLTNIYRYLLAVVIVRFLQEQWQHINQKKDQRSVQKKLSNH